MSLKTVREAGCLFLGSLPPTRAFLLDEATTRVLLEESLSVIVYSELKMQDFHSHQTFPVSKV